MVDPPEVSEELVYQIKKELSSYKQGWTTKQAEDIIIEKKVGLNITTLTYTAFLRKWGFKQKVQRKVHVNAFTTTVCCFQRWKKLFQKRASKILEIKRITSPIPSSSSSPLMLYILIFNQIILLLLLSC